MKRLKTALVWLVLIGVVALLMMSRSRLPEETISFDAFLREVDYGRVSSVNAWGNELTIELHNGSSYRSLGVLDNELWHRLSEAGVVLTEKEPSQGLAQSLVWLLPVVLVVFFVLYFLRKSQGGVGNVMSMRKSPHREVKADSTIVTFDDVGGCDEAKELLRDVVDFLNEPGHWIAAGARLPRGMLLEGPPGCGKTLLARAVAGESNARFFLITASEFVEMFVGVGAARVRDMFESAVKQAPAVVFIDELDAVGRRRGSGIGAGHDEREQTLNQLLVCLDGFHPNDRVVVLAATNRPDVLDQALLRPGRFDRRVRIPELSRAARLEVLQIHTRLKPLASDVDLAEIARRTDGFNGAQLESVANEAAISAVRRARVEQNGRAMIAQGDLLGAIRPVREYESRFDQLDSILIESASQLAEPTGRAVVRLTLRDAPPVEGIVVWADAAFLKLRRNPDDATLLIPKRQILHLHALSGTGDATDIATDAWARSIPGLK